MKVIIVKGAMLKSMDRRDSTISWRWSPSKKKKKSWRWSLGP